MFGDALQKLGMGCAFAALAWSATASGQTESGSAVASASDQPVLQTVVVTAQKRTENLQDVPITVAALSSRELQSRNVGDTQELGLVVPGMTIAESAGFMLAHIRGIGTTAMGAGLESSVATYVDGVYIASPVASLTSLDDVEQVAVLKGPQGTLFGRNATGGLIQVTTKAPQHAFSAEASVTEANFDTTSATAYATGGLSESLAGNIAVSGSHQGAGFGTNLYNGEGLYQMHKDIAARTNWLYTASASTTARLSLDYETRAGNMFTTHNETPGTAPLFGRLPAFANPWDSDLNVQPRESFKGGGGSLQLDHIMEFGELVSASAFRRSEWDMQWDADGTPAPAQALTFAIDDYELTQELQLKSRASSSIRWIAGLFYYGGKDGYHPSDVSGSLIAKSGLDTVRTVGDQRTTALAAYAQVTATVLPATDLTVGMRYSYEKKELDAAEQGLVGPVTIPLIAPVVGRSLSTDKPTWRIALDHKFGPSVMAYVSYDRGFKSGGFNISTPTQPAFKPESLDAYEAGMKLELLNRRLSVDSSVFFYNYSNIQVAQFLGSGQIAYYNGAAARLYGLDESVEAAVTSRLRLGFGIELLHDRFVSFPNAVFLTPLAQGFGESVGSAAGNRLPLAPDVAGDLAVDYAVPVRSSSIDFNVTYGYSSGWYAAPDNVLRQPSYNMINSSATWMSPEGRYSIALWAKNLMDEAVADAINTNPSNSEVTYGPPRTFGVTLRVKF